MKNLINIRVVLLLTLKVVALTGFQFICFTIASSLALTPASLEQSPSDQASGAIALLIVCLLNTIILTILIVRSRWQGWKLVVIIFVLFYGVMTVMSLIETMVFVTHLPSNMLLPLFIMGMIVASLYSTVAVFVLGKWKQRSSSSDAMPLHKMFQRAWLWKMALIAATYLVLYFGFGYFIAWKNPAVRAYYGGNDPGSFYAAIAAVLRQTPWLVPFQILRALMWSALAILGILMMRGRWWERALIVGLLFAVVTSDQLLLPNPYMPQAVRMAHLLETAPSNFIFGFFIGWLLRAPPAYAVPGASQYEELPSRG